MEISFQKRVIYRIAMATAAAAVLAFGRFLILVSLLNHPATRFEIYGKSVL